MSTISETSRLIRRGVLTSAFLLFGPFAQAASTVEHAVNISGWVASETYAGSANSSVLLNVEAGTQVNGFRWEGLVFSASGFNWLADLVLSVSDPDSVAAGSAYLDWSPSVVELPGTYGPGAGAWGGTEGQPGPYLAGAPFAATNSQLLLTVYNAYPAGDTIDILAGTIVISLTPIPEIGSGALMTLGLALTLSFVHRKRSTAMRG